MRKKNHIAKLSCIKNPKLNLQHLFNSTSKRKENFLSCELPVAAKHQGFINCTVLTTSIFLSRLSLMDLYDRILNRDTNINGQIVSTGAEESKNSEKETYAVPLIFKVAINYLQKGHGSK